MQVKYFQTAWNDIKNSPGWFGKLCLLALLNFIPIFGQIVMLGYLYGWAREMAWGAHRPLPSSIFSNDDGKFWRRGWFLLVVGFVFQLVPSIIVGIGNSMRGVSVATYLQGYPHGLDAPVVAAGGVAATAGIGMLIVLVGFVLALLVEVLTMIAFMRTAIYDRLSAGFQLGKIWKMFRHDTSGILKIFGMNLLVSAIIGVICGIALSLVIMIVIAMAAGTTYGSQEANAVAIAFMGIGSLLMLVVLYFTLVGTVFVETLVARALGYWTMQFEVPKWRGQDDPLPFELVSAPAYSQPANPTGAYPGNQPFDAASGQQPYGSAGTPSSSASAGVAPAQEIGQSAYPTYGNEGFQPQATVQQPANQAGVAQTPYGEAVANQSPAQQADNQPIAQAPVDGAVEQPVLQDALDEPRGDE